MASRVEINEAELRRLLTGGSGAVVRHVEDITRKVTNAAKRKAPNDEGIGKGTISGIVSVTGGRVIGRVGTSLDYMIYQSKGTGLYGPNKREIVPIHAKALRFEVKSGTAAKGNRPFVFARSVKGVKPNPYLQDALKEESPYPVTEN